jgi:hypothetical protein
MVLRSGCDCFGGNGGSDKVAQLAAELENSRDNWSYELFWDRHKLVKKTIWVFRITQNVN